jgi:hypothetical protein
MFKIGMMNILREKCAKIGKLILNPLSQILKLKMLNPLEKLKNVNLKK